MQADELLAMVRSKYNAYHDLEDEDLTNRLLEKYPVYGSVLRPQASAPQDEAPYQSRRAEIDAEATRQARLPNADETFTGQVEERATNAIPDFSKAALSGEEQGINAAKQLGMGETSQKVWGVTAGFGNVAMEMYKPIMPTARYPFVVAAALGDAAAGDTQGAADKLANPDQPVVSTQYTNVQPFGIEHNNLNALVDVFGDTAKSVFLENPELAALAVHGVAAKADLAYNKLSSLIRDRHAEFAPTDAAPQLAPEALDKLNQGLAFDPTIEGGATDLPSKPSTLPDVQGNFDIPEMDAAQHAELDNHVTDLQSTLPNLTGEEQKAVFNAYTLDPENPEAYAHQSGLTELSEPKQIEQIAIKLAQARGEEFSAFKDISQDTRYDAMNAVKAMQEHFRDVPAPVELEPALKAEESSSLDFNSKVGEDLSFPTRPKFIAEPKDFQASEPAKVSPTTAAIDPTSKGFSIGPGAASEAEVLQHKSQMAQLTDIVKDIGKTSDSIPERVNKLQAILNQAKNIKDSFSRGLLTVKAIGSTFHNALTDLPKYTDMHKALGNWLYELSHSDFETRKFGRDIKTNTPSALRREAITNYVQADGDIELLKSRASASDKRYKPGYEMAQQLTDKEKVFAENIRQYFDSMLKAGVDSGVVKHGLENYVNQMWERGNSVTDKLLADVSMNRLQPNFKFARKRIFDSFFEGEQAGHTPKTKDIGALVSAYNSSFNQSLAARGFIKQLLTEAKGSDGRPLAVLSGSVASEPTGESSATFIRPQVKPKEFGDYKFFDHPALKGWKWGDKTPEGRDLFLEGNAWVHPEVYQHLKNVLSKSAIRQNIIGRAALDIQGAAKQSMMSLSAFHLVQEAEHALGHRINPLNVGELNYDHPVQKELIQHGLQPGTMDALSAFSEGLSGGGLTGKIPGVGKVLTAAQEWLFTEYIPRLKMSMGLDAFERNLSRYEKDMHSGKVTRDQIADLTARQANAAFGELNYKYMGRNPTLQDVLRLTLLAPDFLEARGRFAAQSVTKYGGEQRAALALLGLTTYVSSRILNKLINDDYHWEKPFSVVFNGKEFGFRTVPGDMYHMVTQPRQFWYGRLSPLYGRGGVEALSGVDYRGAKVGWETQMQDTLKSFIPMNMVRARDKTIMDTFLNSVGLATKDYTPGMQIYQMSKDFNKQTGYKDADAETFQQSKYFELKQALRLGDTARAAQSLQALRRESNPATLIKGLKQSFDPRMPFTGSKRQEVLFLQSLDPQHREYYRQAVSEKIALNQKLMQLISTTPR